MYFFSNHEMLGFCDQISVPQLPATSETLQLYVTYLAKVKRFKFCSIQQYLNIIPHMHKLCDLLDPIPQDFQLKYLLMGEKRELGTAQAPVDTMTQIIYLGSVHYWTVLPLQTLLFGVPASSFDPSKHVRRIYFVLCSWGCLLCLQHKKTIQFR